MTDAPRVHRHELKAPFEESLLPVVRGWVIAHQAAFRREWPSRTVNSLYFDSHGWNCLRDGLEGALERGKLRLRWYGPLFAEGPFNLEWKSKQGQMGWKLSCAIKLTGPLDGYPVKGLFHDVSVSAGDQIKELLGRFRVPAVINSYERDYFITADGLIRLTLDYNLRFIPQPVPSRVYLRRRSRSAGICVLELKFPISAAERAESVMGEFPFRISACSKYTAGITGQDPLL